MVVGFTGLLKTGQLKVEGITDEFSRLVKTQDIMAKLDAVIEGEMDDGFNVRDENVNATARSAGASGETTTTAEPHSKAGSGKEKGASAKTKKRASTGKAPAKNKKTKTS